MPSILAFSEKECRRQQPSGFRRCTEGTLLDDSALESNCACDCSITRDIKCGRRAPSSHILLDSSEESRLLLAVMLQKEETVYSCPDYLSPKWLAEQSQSGNSASPEPTKNKNNRVPAVDDCTNLVAKLGLNASGVIAHDKALSRDLSKSHSPSTITTSSDNLIDLHGRSKPVVTPNLEYGKSFLGPWRTQMVAWAFSVADTFALDRELVPFAFRLLDRYLAKEIQSSVEEPITREEFQLFAMTALYITAKTLEPTRKLSIESIMDMSRGFYSEEDILASEIHMLHKLEWHLNPPTEIDFVRLLINTTGFHSSPQFMDKCRRITELALQDSSLLARRASCLAAAAVLYCAEQDCSYSESSINQFLMRVNDLGVGVADTMTVYRRLEILAQ